MDRYVKANIAFSKFSRDYSQLKKCLPIRQSEMGVLNIITRREGLFTPVMIAELLEVSKPIIAAHISSLEQKGYIVKDFSSRDKRSFYVIPTDKARALVEETEIRLGEHMQTMERQLGEERFNTLVELLEETQQVLSRELR